MEKWKLIVTRRVSIFRSFVMAQGSQNEMKKYLGLKNDFLVVTKNGISNVYYRTRDLEAISERIIQKIAENPRFPTTHARDCLSVCKHLVGVSEQNASFESAHQMTAGELRDRFLRYLRAYLPFVKFVTIPVAIEKTLTDNLVRYITQIKEEKNVQRCVNLLTTAPKLSETQKEQIDLTKLALVIKRQKGESYSNLLLRHMKKYQWLSCYNIDESPFTTEYFEKRLQDLLNLEISLLIEQIERSKEQLSSDEKHFQETLTGLNLPKSLSGQAQLLRQYVYMRTYRIEMQSKANFLIQPLFQKIANSFNLSLRELTAASPDEIIKLLSDTWKPTSELLEKRIPNHVILSVNKKIELYLNTRAEFVAKHELGNALENNEVRKLRGMVAYPGNVSGVVRVIQKKDELSQFQKGEILVTVMTSPEFVPAMRMAKAIITDEGGVLCHAAIIAREFKVPCIIGSQKATSALKTGDRVAIDGVNGVITLI